MLNTTVSSGETGRRIRQALAAAGFVGASATPPASLGRAAEATIRPARLVEGKRLTAHLVGSPEMWSGAVAFLDGVQRQELLGYVGTSPLLLAEVAAAVRERRDRQLRTAVEARRVVVLGRAEALEQAAGAVAGCDTEPIDASGPPHPVADLTAASRLVDRLRGNLELEVGDRYTGEFRPADGWLVVDGALSVSPAWAADRQMVGISKSHSTLPFEGEDLERYLRLPPGHRSSIFAPAGAYAPVHAWALRLWPWEGRDLFHGLIRVEVAPAAGTPDEADRLSRRLLAERTPISAPDGRWDRLLYGIAGVEEYLRRS